MDLQKSGLNLLILAATLISIPLYGLGDQTPYQRLQGPKVQSKKNHFYNLPMKKSSSETQRRGFSLWSRGAVDLDAAVASFVAERAAMFGVKLLPKKRTSFSLSQNESNTNRFYNMSFMGVEFCHAEMKAFQFPNNNEPVIIGNIPEFLPGQSIDANDWPEFSVVMGASISEMSQRGFDHVSLSQGSAQKCIFVEDGFLVPAWRFTLMHQGLPYESIASHDTIYQLDAKFFNVGGQANAYVRNPHYPSIGSPEIETVTLSDLTGDGYLTNNVFTTAPVDEARVYDVNHDFTGVTAGDSGFAEMNSFVHANHTLSWFEALGFSYAEEKKLSIKVHYVFPGGDINNAVYKPSVDGPRILIADGGMDGSQVKLENLPFDGDVVSHEFAHHVIFQSVTTTSEGSESLVLHEGLADAFTFLRTGDACLGESICPADSTFPCYEKGACLRSGDNTLNFTDPDLDSGAHIRGQFISGLIWDLKKSNAIPTNNLSNILVKSIDLLLHDSGYLHLILAMMTVDRELYNGQYNCEIYDAALARGLGAAIEDFSCTDDTLPLIDESTQTPIGSEVEQASGSSSSVSGKKTNKETSLCGFIHVPVGSQTLVLVVLLLGPLLLVRRRHSA